MKVLLLNGPNLDLLGVRETAIYGTTTLVEVEQLFCDAARKRGIVPFCFQSNHEGVLIDALHDACGLYDGIVYNPGAHAHYSYALRDAIAAIDVPVVEVHISDIDAREPFRALSVLQDVCVAQVKGMGVAGYVTALDMLFGKGLDG